jgi:hypothetical protein
LSRWPGSTAPRCPCAVLKPLVAAACFLQGRGFECRPGYRLSFLVALLDNSAILSNQSSVRLRVEVALTYTSCGWRLLPETSVHCLRTNTRGETRTHVQRKRARIGDVTREGANLLALQMRILQPGPGLVEQRARNQSLAQQCRDGSPSTGPLATGHVTARQNLAWSDAVGLKGPPIPSQINPLHILITSQP